MKFIMPIILIIISVGVFFVFTNPLYNEVAGLRAEIVSYNQALDNSKALEDERDKLTLKENSFDPTNVLKLRRLLPDNIDNIRLILEIEQIALPYGMVLKDVKYDAKAQEEEEVKQPQGGGVAVSAPEEYGVWDLGFSTTGTYSNFINFLRDLESNLRIVDVSSITFSSENTSSRSASGSSAPSTTSPSSEIYKYDFKIKTYWLKN